MAYLFLMLEQPALVGPVTGQLLDAGVVPEKVRIFSTRPSELPEVPFASRRYRSPMANMAYGALGGALVGALVGLALLAATGLGPLALLALVLALGIGSALSRYWYGHGISGDLYGLDDALQRGATVVVVDAERHRAVEMGRAVKNRHPEVAVLGTDTEGTPPFP